MVYTSGNKKYFGRVYSSGIAYGEKLKKTLIGMGYMEVGSFMPSLDKFEIPATQLANGALVMPLPYFDNVACDFKVSFDKVKNVFCVTPNLPGMPAECRDWLVVGRNSTNGYVRAEAVIGLECEVCKRKVPPRDVNNYNVAETTHSTRGLFICSKVCLSKSPYVLAHRSDGHRIMLDRDAAVKDELTTDFYTNAEAAHAHNAAPVLMDNIIPEDP
jgi:hypothetical protein